MALGNLILDETGQVMGMRVLSNDANGGNVEASIHRPPEASEECLKTLCGRTIF